VTAYLGDCTLVTEQNMDCHLSLNDTCVRSRLGICVFRVLILYIWQCFYRKVEVHDYRN